MKLTDRVRRLESPLGRPMGEILRRFTNQPIEDLTDKAIAQVAGVSVDLLDNGTFDRELERHIRETYRLDPDQNIGEWARGTYDDFE